MRKLLPVLGAWLFAALLFTFGVFCAHKPAQAQQVVTQSSGIGNAFGNLAVLNDTVVLPITGNQFATVKFRGNTIGATASITTEISIDGGTNWFASALSRQLNIVTNNPSLYDWGRSNGTLSAAAIETWETPLPSNATHFRLRCPGAGTTQSVTILPGQLYVPGTPVLAVLYDVSVSSGLAIDTGILDVSGWNAATVKGFQSGAAGGTFQVTARDDTGAIFGGNAEYGAVLATNVPFYVNYGFGTTSGPSRGATTEAIGMLPRRIEVTISAIAVTVPRIRIEVRR